jgi:hypothetical protein
MGHLPVYVQVIITVRKKACETPAGDIMVVIDDKSWPCFAPLRAGGHHLRAFYSS